MAFLHGVETIERLEGPVPIRSARTAVVGIVGTAPTWALDPDNATKNQMVQILSPDQAAQYAGGLYPDYTLPRAMKSIHDQGAGLIIMINVFDWGEHTATAENESVTFGPRDRLQLAHFGVKSLVLTDEELETVYEEGVDFEYTPAGEVRRLDSGSIPYGATVVAGYTYADPTKVTAAEVLGGTDPITGKRTGLALFREAYSQFGFAPKMIHCPVFNTQQSVGAEMLVLANELRAKAIFDAPAGTTYAEAIASRGPQGTVQTFNTDSDRAMLLFPHLKAYNPITDEDELVPYSSFWCGVRARVDNNDTGGYWASASNHEIRGITGVEFALTSSINDPNTETNMLNDAGITTVFQMYGVPPRVWGNRTAAWPSTTTINNFETVRTTADVIHESVEMAVLQFIDRPIDNALIDSIVESVNAFIRSLVARRAILDGRCWYDPEDNPPADVALGWLRFRYDFGPKVPGERFTFIAITNANYLANLGG